MQTRADVGLTRIGQIAVPVHDLGRAVDYYRTTLGMRYLFTAGSLAFFECGGVRLMLSAPESADEEHRGSVLYYAVENIDAAFAALSARGVQFEDTPHLIARMETHEVWMAFFRDSEHNLLAIMSEIPHITT